MASNAESLLVESYPELQQNGSRLDDSQEYAADNGAREMAQSESPKTGHSTVVREESQEELHVQPRNERLVSCLVHSRDGGIIVLSRTFLYASQLLLLRRCLPIPAFGISQRGSISALATRYIAAQACLYAFSYENEILPEPLKPWPGPVMGL